MTLYTLPRPECKSYTVPAWLRPVRVSSTDMHAVLRRALASHEPEAMRFLRSVWKSQGRSVTDAQIDAMLRNGRIPAEVEEAIRSSYAKFAERLVNETERGMVDKVGGAWARGAGAKWEVSKDLMETLTVRGGKLAVELGKGTLQTIDYLADYHIQMGSTSGAFAADIRSFISLTKAEVEAVSNMRAGLIISKFPPDVVRRQATLYAQKLEQARAMRIARTELAYSAREGVNSAVEQAREQGLIEGELVRVWSAAADEATCPICGELDGQRARWGEPFNLGGETYDDPPAHPSCILPGNRITASGLYAATKSFYVGPAVEIRLEGGSVLTVTENHPVLTPNGFVAAGMLSKGAHVLCCSDVEGASPRINPHDDYRDTPIEQVFRSLVMTSAMPSCGMKPSAEDFHGDGIFIKGDVEVVCADGLLRSASNTEAEQHPDEFHFEDVNVGDELLSPLGAPDELLGRVLPSENCSVCRCCECGALFCTCALHSEFHRCGSPSRDDAAVNEVTANGRPLDAEFSGEGQLGIAGDVTVSVDGKVRDDGALLSHGASRPLEALIDAAGAQSESLAKFLDTRSGLIQVGKILEVRRVSFRGHVYDLQCNPHGVYTCSSVLVKNCRCVPILEQLLPGETE